MFLSPGMVQQRREVKKGVADGTTKDADDAQDDTERSDTMKNTPDAVTMLSVAQTVALLEDGLAEMRTLLFRRKKQREKQRT